MKVGGLLVSATRGASCGGSWAAKSLNKWPLSYLALLSASELKIKTVKFELFFSFHLRKEHDLQQLKNNHRTTTGVLSGLPVYG